ncbi:MAG: RidA family protein [Rhodospirillales bacterium]|jgi:enamine deaminase RidA (YjgF/YER057c/UK114 family)|nr:RidA family protein [Rhodospirillales bacterium]
MVRHYNPPALGAPAAPYSHCAEINPGARYLFCAGQTGRGQDGEALVGIEAQAERVFERLRIILEEAGMGPENVVKMTQYVVDPDEIPIVLAARAHMLGEIKPPDTLLCIARLAHPDLRLEVELVAAAEE